MKEITNNLYVGSLADYQYASTTDFAFVHATQTIHYQIMNWDRRFNKPDKNHPNYIVWEKENRLSLNWVDGAAHLYNWSGTETFIKVLDFVDKWIKNKKVLIHCDQAISRSPNLGLLYLAKRGKTIPNSSYNDAYREFIKLYPNYQPGGIGDYVNMHWNVIS